MRQEPPVIRGLSGWRPLARGGFATVWQARQETLDRLVAVKVDDRRLDSEAARRRFLAEAQAAGKLSGHAGIITVHDADILTDGRPYLVMELCPGGSLTRWLAPENRQSPDRVRAVGIRIADALAVAHAEGMLHRDVKPANILIDSHGRAGLADFGLAAAPGAGAVGEVTPPYAAPEVLRRQPVTERSDVYQLAATLYALLSGRPPRDIPSNMDGLALAMLRVDEPVDPLPDVDERFMGVLLRALSPVPIERPTAAELRDQLAALGPVPGGASPYGTVIARPRLTPGRRLALALVAASVVSVLVILLGGTGVYLYEIDRSVTANISRGIEMPPEGAGDEARPPVKAETDRSLDYVLIGTDDRNSEFDQGGRSDSVMLVHLSRDRDQAYVVSFPRDLWVQIPGQGERRMNAAYETGGAPLVVRTVERLTGVRVDHVAKIDFQGFVGLTEDLGGVTVLNSAAFTNDGHSFARGLIPVSGERALAFVRARSGGEDQRAENQRNVLKAILTKGLSAEVLADPARFTRFAGNAAKWIQVDNDLTDAKLRSTALSLRLKPSNIALLSAPLGRPGTREGETVRLVDRVKLDELDRALGEDAMAEYVRKYPRG